MKILPIGPHPDDVEIGMGGAILALRAQDDDVTICDFTNGEPTPVGTPERYGKLTKTTIPGEPFPPKRILHYFATHYRLHPDFAFIFDISGHVDRKLDAVRAYASQCGPQRGNEGFLTSCDCGTGISETSSAASTASRSPAARPSG